MDGFCPHCDVSLDLHDGPDSCQSATHKANVLDAFDRMLAGVMSR